MGLVEEGEVTVTRQVGQQVDQVYWEEQKARLQSKVNSMIEQLGDKCPHVAKSDGVYDNTQTDWWTSGFWPGILWIMYEITGEEHYKQAAWPWDERIERWLINPSQELHHDVGFQFLPTAVVKYELTGDTDGYRRGMQAANFLAGRYNTEGQFIRAWNFDKIGWAIIDCMMNLSLLFWASRESGDPRYKHIAIRHTDTVLKYFLREDGSVNHIVSFNPETGEFIEALGGQGFGPDSAWSRGASWALYGLANAYRNTGDQRYLDGAKRAANYFIASLPDDHVPLWDFRTESAEGEPKDSSAGAIAASGLLEIARHVSVNEARLYRGKAERIIRSLTECYMAGEGHEAILLHGTGYKPAGQNIDVSLIYGDYFYVEAIAKLNGWRRDIF